MSFTLKFPMNIVFGEGTIKSLGEECLPFGKRGMIVTGRSSSRRSGALDKTIDSLRKSNIDYILYDQISGEPDTNIVDYARRVAKEEEVDFIIGLGGGSALDVAKATAGLHGQVCSTVNYLEKMPFNYQGIPFVGIPTTAGTASEITLNSVLYNPRRGNKYSIARSEFRAKLALVDPGLTYSMGAKLTATTGMDALTHAIESYTSKEANPVTQALAGQAISLINNSLLRAVDNGNDMEARRDMALGSMLAGLAFSQTGVGLAHSISHPLGGIFHISHGVANAILLAKVIDFNNRECENCYKDIANLMGGKGSASGQVRKLLERLPLPDNLISVGYKRGREEDVINKTFESRSLKKNPRMPNRQDVLDIINACL